MKEKDYIVGIFNDEEPLIQATRVFKEKNIPVADIFTPYPVHEIIQIQGETSKLTLAAYIYGWIGGLGILAFLYYTAVISWPLNYGGKPSNAFPSFILITLVFVILFVTIMSLTTFIARARLFPGKKIEIIDPRATDDKFVVVLHGGDENKDQVIGLLKESGAEEVYEK